MDLICTNSLRLRGSPRPSSYFLRDITAGRGGNALPLQSLYVVGVDGGDAAVSIS